MFQKSMNLSDLSPDLNSLLADPLVMCVDKVELITAMLNNRVYPHPHLCNDLKKLLNEPNVPSEDKVYFAKHLLNFKFDISMYRDVLVNLIADENVSPVERINLVTSMFFNNYDLKDQSQTLQSLVLSYSPNAISLAAEMLFRGFNLSVCQKRLRELVRLPKVSLLLRAKLANNMVLAGIDLFSESDTVKFAFDQELMANWHDSPTFRTFEEELEIGAFN